MVGRELAVCPEQLLTFSKENTSIKRPGIADASDLRPRKANRPRKMQWNVFMSVTSITPMGLFFIRSLKALRL